MTIVLLCIQELDHWFYKIYINIYIYIYILGYFEYILMLVSLRSSPLSLYVCVKILSILNKKKKKKTYIATFIRLLNTNFYF